MAACWRCGSETPTDAKFCPECGAELRAVVTELEPLVDPGAASSGHVEATEAPPSRWLLVGAVALIGALVAFFALVGGEDEWPSADPFEDRADFEAIDEPDGDTDDDATEEPTTTETTDEPSVGELVGDLDWEIAFTGGVGIPTQTVDIGDSTFLYSIAGDTPWATGGELHTYQRGPDDEWTDVGATLPAGARVTATWPTLDGALAVGANADGEPTLWRTNDGTTWDTEVLPPLNEPRFDGALPRVAAANDGRTFVIGSPPDPWAQLRDEVHERFPTIDAGFQVDGGPGGPETITVRGPFGIVIDEFDLAEFGIDPELLDAYNGEFVEVPVWESSGDGWTLSTTTEGQLHGVITTDDQVLGLFAYDSGPELRALERNGWGEPLRFEHVWQVEPWGERFVGAGRASGMTVFDEDGAIIDHYAIPGGEAMGHVASVTANDTGLVVVESIWQSTEEPETQVRTMVLRDGYTLEAGDGELELRLGETTVLRSSLFWQGGSDRYTVDLQSPEPQVTFLGEDGEPLVAFTFAELADLEERTYNLFDSRERLRVLFTADGSTWHGGEIDAQDTFGWIHTHLTDQKIIGAQLQVDGDARNLRPDEYGFTIIEALLPD